MKPPQPNRQSLKTELSLLLVEYAVKSGLEAMDGHTLKVIKITEKSAQAILSAIELRLPPRLENKVEGNTSVAYDPGFREGYNQALGDIKQLLK